MSLQHCYFVVNSGVKPPKEFFDAVLAKYPDAVSCVFVKKGEEEGSEYLEVYPAIANASAEDCIGLLDDVGDSKAIFWACKGTPSEGDIQPFDILEDGEGKKHIVVFADGDFTSYVKTDSSLSPEVFAVSEYLAPKILSLQEKADNLDDAIDELNTPLIKKEIETMLFGGTRGCATVFASTGKCETFVNKNTTGLNAEWGYSTDHCGYGQQETKKNKFVASKPAGTLPVKPPAEDGKVAPAATTPAGMVNIKPSSLIQGNTNAMKFYMEATGWTEAEVKEKIPNYMFRTEVVQVPEAKLPELRKKQFAKNFNVVVTTPAPAAAAAPTSVPVVSAVASKSKGNTPVVDGKTKVVAVPLPIMSTATKSAVTSWMDTELPKTILDSSSKKTSTIEEIKTLNQNYADWFRQLSKEDQREASVFWPYQMIHDQTRPEPANTREARIQSQGILCFNMMCRAALAEDRVKQLEEKYEPAEPVVTEVVVVGSSDIGVRKNKFTASKLKTG